MTYQAQAPDYAGPIRRSWHVAARDVVRRRQEGLAAELVEVETGKVIPLEVKR